jgi:hypothetical protein
MVEIESHVEHEGVRWSNDFAAAEVAINTFRLQILMQHQKLAPFYTTLTVLYAELKKTIQLMLDEHDKIYDKRVPRSKFSVTMTVRSFCLPCMCNRCHIDTNAYSCLQLDGDQCKFCVDSVISIITRKANYPHVFKIHVMNLTSGEQVCEQSLLLISPLSPNYLPTN